MTQDNARIKATPVYYHGTDQQHDDILRCKDCKKLIVMADLATHGGCPKCGNRKVTEVRNLSFWEWFLIRIGYINFPSRAKFLREFSK